MKSFQALAEFVSDRLTAVAVEIFSEFEQTVVQYEEQIDGQHRLLDIRRKDQMKPIRAELNQHHVCKEEQLWNQDNLIEKSDSPQTEDTEPLQIKEEPILVQIKEEPELVQIKEEPDLVQIIEVPDPPETNHHQEQPHTSWIKQNQEVQCSMELLLEPFADGENDPAKQICLNSAREFINHCLTAAAVEMSTMFEQTLGRYKEEINRRQKLMNITMNAQMRLQRKDAQQPHVSVKQQQCNQSGSSFVRQEQHQMEEKQEVVKPPNIEEKQGNPEFLHPCQTCGKQFRKKCNLLDHIRIHTGERPYTCETCGKGFTQKGSLQYHKRTHTGEKPYSCEACGDCFRNNQTLLRHIRTHIRTGEKPFSCEQCGNGFSDRVNLVRHIRNHTSEKAYRCDTCGEIFAWKCVLLNHMRRHK